MSFIESLKNSATTAVTTATNILSASGFISKETVERVSRKRNTESKIPNPLHDYASYNYLFSLAVLGKEDFNGAQYKTKGANGPFLAKSASMKPEERVQTTAGKFEFFIEDVKIEHIAGWEKSTQNTNATGFTFRIVEPYSMGLFFQALQSRAIELGYRNYPSAPLLLTIEFKGHKNPDEQMISIDRTTRHYPLNLIEMEMKVSKQGCVYDVRAIPASDKPFEDAIVTLTTDASIVGDTVGSMLKTHPEKSLEVYLNNRIKDQKRDYIVSAPDRYEIEFPPLLDGSPNPISSASMNFSQYTATETPFAKDNLTYDEKTGIYKRGSIAINWSESEFRFTAGSDIINAINQVVLMSEYGRNALKNISADGMVTWWRVETRVYYLPVDETKITNGVLPMKYVYRVLPYEVNSSPANVPNEKQKGVESLKIQAVKQYNYIYTGANIDILDFDITFRNGFYKTFTPSANKNAGDVITTNKQATAETANSHDDNRKVNQYQLGQTKVATGSVPTEARPSQLSTITSNQGGGGRDNAASLAAKQFQTVLTAGVDMVQLEISILGDPYFLGDSGVGNYTAEPGESKFVNKDGAINYDQVQPHVVINFLTPTDIDPTTGMYDFSNLTVVDQLSGLYRIHQLTSNFNRGKFTQDLKMLRIPHQNDAEGEGKTLFPPNPETPNTTDITYYP